jgi:Molybdopterin converting factor, large subunit
VGALVTFSGVCRGDEAGDPIAALTLEHYPGMAEVEITRHVREAEGRWPLLDVHIVHRVGRIVPGEIIVVVAVASAHRQAAFAAAEFLMDYLKTRAPFWKRESGPGKSTWIDSRAGDDAAAARWEKKRAAE